MAAEAAANTVAAMAKAGAIDPDDNFYKSISLDPVRHYYYRAYFFVQIPFVHGSDLTIHSPEPTIGFASIRYLQRDGADKPRSRHHGARISRNADTSPSSMNQWWSWCA